MPKTVSCPSCGAPVPIGAGSTGRCTFCGSTVYLSPGEIPAGRRSVADETAEIRQLVRSGNRIQAIRQLHTRYHTDLKTAIDLVDRIAGGENVDLGAWPLRGTVPAEEGAARKTAAWGCVPAGIIAAVMASAAVAYLLMAG